MRQGDEEEALVEGDERDGEADAEYTDPEPWDEESASYDEAGALTEAPSTSGETAAGRAVAEGGPDVYLDVPVPKVDEIDLDVEDLRARVSLQAEALDLLKLNVGADVTLGRVHLGISGVEAQAQLTVRLDTSWHGAWGLPCGTSAEAPVMPSESSVRVPDAPSTTSAVGRGVGAVAEDFGEGAGAAVQEVGRGAGSAAEDLGEGAGAAVQDVGRGARRAVEDVGRGGRPGCRQSRPEGRIRDRECGRETRGGGRDDWRGGGGRPDRRHGATRRQDRCRHHLQGGRHQASGPVGRTGCGAQARGRGPGRTRAESERHAHPPRTGRGREAATDEDGKLPPRPGRRRASDGREEPP